MYSVSLKKGRKIKTALSEFHAHCGEYPSQEIGLIALKELSQKKYQDCWKGPYLIDDLKDEWGNEFVYKTNQRTYELVFLGMDGKVGGIDYNEDFYITNDKEN